MVSPSDIETKVLVGICLNAAVSLLLGAIVFNWTLTFYMLTKCGVEPLTERRPKSVLLFGIVICIALLIRIPIFATFIYNGIGGFPKNEFIVNISVHCTTLGMIYILVFRIYLVYYDMKFSEALKDQNWMLHIDTSHQHKNWFVQNKNICGNPKKVATVLILIWGIYTIFGTAMTEHNPLHLIPIVLSVMTSLIALSILSYKLPKFNDVWKLGSETQKLCIVEIIVVVLFFVIRFVLKPKTGTIKQNFLTTYHIFILFIPCYYSFFWVFKKFRLPTNIWSVKYYNVSKLQLDTISETNESNEKQILFKDVLSECDWFKLFARQLLNEFAIEHLLFFIETQQFAEAISRLNPLQSDNEQQQNEVIQLAMCTPISTIVSEINGEIHKSDNMLHRVYEAASKLFLKYVLPDANFGINVSWAVREELYEIFGYQKINYSSDKKIQQQIVEKLCSDGVSYADLQHVFDSATRETLRLLTHSFSRFKLSDAFSAHVQIVLQ